MKSLHTDLVIVSSKKNFYVLAETSVWKKKRSLNKEEIEENYMLKSCLESVNNKEKNIPYHSLIPKTGQHK